MNGTHSINCHGYGNPLPDITWWKYGDQLTSNAPRITQSEKLLYLNSTHQLIISMLTVNGFLLKDAGNYSCRVSNTYGSDAAHFEILVHIPGTHLNIEHTNSLLFSHINIIIIILLNTLICSSYIFYTQCQYSGALQQCYYHM